MAIKKINDDLSEIGKAVRVERGPARKTATATEKLLGDAATAPHYKVGLPDARGVPIAIGKPMTYLDWLGPRGWYVYALAKADNPNSWTEDSFYADQADALARGQALAKS